MASQFPVLEFCAKSIATFDRPTQTPKAVATRQFAARETTPNDHPWTKNTFFFLFFFEINAKCVFLIFFYTKQPPTLIPALACLVIKYCPPHCFCGFDQTKCCARQRSVCRQNDSRTSSTRFQRKRFSSFSSFVPGSVMGVKIARTHGFFFFFECSQKKDWQLLATCEH